MARDRLICFSVGARLGFRCDEASCRVRSPSELGRARILLNRFYFGSGSGLEGAGHNEVSLGVPIAAYGSGATEFRAHSCPLPDRNRHPLGLLHLSRYLSPPSRTAGSKVQDNEATHEQ
jgi:hypothetical protein